MTERIDPGGGGMTGATGDLTPEGPEESFVPGERREVEDPDARGTVTYRQATGAPSQRGEVGDPAGDEVDGGPTDMAVRESGYGSEHGLAPDDPAYRMEINPPAGGTPSGERRRERGEPRLGGDEVSGDEEHF